LNQFAVAWFLSRFFRPSPGLALFSIFPTACDVACILSLLRGWPYRQSKSESPLQKQELNSFGASRLISTGTENQHSHFSQNQGEVGTLHLPFLTFLTFFVPQRNFSVSRDELSGQICFCGFLFRLKVHSLRGINLRGT